jgi:hypothetical protein
VETIPRQTFMSREMEIWITTKSGNLNILMIREADHAHERATELEASRRKFPDSIRAMVESLDPKLERG